MAAIKQEVKVFEVDFECDSCHLGVMRPNGRVLLTHPAKYSHECTKCGYTQAFPLTYPTTIYEKI